MKIKNENFLKRVIIMIIGIIIMGFGVMLFKISMMGNDPSTAMSIAIAEKVNIDFSLMVIGFQCFCFLAEKKYDKDLIGIGTFVNWFLVGPLASLYEKMIRSFFVIPDSFISRLILMSAGVVFLSLSASLYQTAQVGIAPYDAVSIIISKKTGRKYFWCRIFTDSVCVIIAFIFGGIIGPGTLICAIGLGPFIQFFTEIAAKPLISGSFHKTTGNLVYS